MPPIKLLGIDPGSIKTGYGIILTDGYKHQHLASGTLNVKADSIADRLLAIFDGLSEVILEHQPNEVAIETVFLSKNFNSALKLGQARGAAITAAAKAGLEVFEYAPRAIKLAVVGYGGADKAQIQHMVRALLKINRPLKEDEADGLAIAVCHAHSRSLIHIK